MSLSDCGVQPSRLPALGGVRFSRNGEILDSDNDDHDDGLASVGEIVARSRRRHVQTQSPELVIDLLCDSDNDDTEVSRRLDIT